MGYKRASNRGSGSVTTRAIATMCAVACLICESAGLAADSKVAEQALPAPVAAPVTATDLRVGGDDKQTRFVVDLSQKIDLAAFTLANPYRVVVDLPQITFKLPPDIGGQGRGLVKAFRYGLIMQGGSRIVLDTKGPVRIERAFVLEATDAQPARLVLDLVATDRVAFMRNLAMQTPSSTHRVAIKPNEAPEKPNGDSRPLIVLDAGHGGIDTGTRGSGGELEKDVVLAFVQALREKLESGGKYRVALTRSDDTFIALGERVRFARARNAALFISVHADALPKNEGQAEGATVYTLSENASDAEAARLAETENKADVIAGVDLTSEPDDVANILVDLAQRETKTFSMQFARTVVDELKSAARLHKHPLKSAGFKVLLAPDVPSVLIELGYMSTKEDLKQLNSAVWRARTAQAIVKAVETYFTPRVAGGKERR
ncbi:MAG TPA: N-acetylmuramoyl-L-alanine amidase [Pseudolabrys sp.]|nr:N-acetylmuramoyl-L-alanine amidase [Pseudolabrys sp.]